MEIYILLERITVLKLLSDKDAKRFLYFWGYRTSWKPDLVFAARALEFYSLVDPKHVLGHNNEQKLSLLHIFV